MKTFDIPPQSRLKIVKATPRKEKHGNELVQAISLRIEWWPTENSALNLLHPGLQDMVFWTPPEVEAQCQLDGIPMVKKHIRVPTVVRPWKVEGEFTGYTLQIEHGIDESSALELYSCGLDKFEADAKEGGSATIRWSLATNSEVTPELVGALCALEGTEVIGTLTPPDEPAEEGAIDGTTHAFLRDHPDAGDMFAAQHGGDGEPGEGGDGGDDQPHVETGAEHFEPVHEAADNVRTGRRTARGRDKTKAALEAGAAAHADGEAV